jgi:hypothetical protein
MSREARIGLSRWLVKLESGSTERFARNYKR